MDIKTYTWEITKGLDDDTERNLRFLKQLGVIEDSFGGAFHQRFVCVEQSVINTRVFKLLLHLRSLSVHVPELLRSLSHGLLNGLLHLLLHWLLHLRVALRWWLHVPLIYCLLIRERL